LSSKRRTRLPGDPLGREWITVTSPLLPDFDALVSGLADIYERRWLTNQGHYVRTLEGRLAGVLEVPFAQLVTNATIGLELAVKAALPEGGEVITTGYSFPATWHVLLENPRTTPRFVDVRGDYTIDPDAVEAAITPHTRGILAVHAYGFPCQTASLAEIASRHGLKLIYDAAHVFGCRQGGQSMAAFGDVSVFSFHATKVFSTLEGGAICSQDQATAQRVARLRNFGIVDEDNIELIGVNGKMDEFRALFGLLSLDIFEQARIARAAVSARYLARLAAEKPVGLHSPADLYATLGYEGNHSYFPVHILPESGTNRDAVMAHLREAGVHARKYFHPTVPTAPVYASLVPPEGLPRTAELSRSVLCLPIHHNMEAEDCDIVMDALLSALRNAAS
jgi:dTDP-4-amino-4,6-dideoxygalactose transaminase